MDSQTIASNFPQNHACESFVSTDSTGAKEDVVVPAATGFETDYILCAGHLGVSAHDVVAILAPVVAMSKRN